MSAAFSRHGARMDAGVGPVPSAGPFRRRAADSGLQSEADEARLRAGGVLAANSLEKSFGKRKVLKSVSIDVHPGEIVGLLGPNGAGKTTTFYCVVGLAQPDVGSITLGDEDLTDMPMFERARSGISYLPQEASVFRGLTVAENVRAILETLPLGPEEREERLRFLLDELSISHLADTSAAALSGGERRRLEITRALVISPAFILLDEPFAGIDPIAVIDIQKIIRFLKERGIGVLITDHNVRETLGICDRATIINAGEVLAAGHPADIVDNESVRKVYLGEHFKM